MEESLLAWRLNGGERRTILCSPGEEEALLRGLMVTSLAVPAPGALLSVGKEGDEWWIRTRGDVRLFDLRERLDLIPRRPAPSAPPEGEAERLAAMLRSLPGGDGLHTALLSVRGTVWSGRDLGRHNALDKAVGKALLAGVSPAGAVLCTSGRLSLEMLLKAAAAGAAWFVCAKQRGSLALNYAKEWGVGIIETPSVRPRTEKGRHEA